MYKPIPIRELSSLNILLTLLLSELVSGLPFNKSELELNYHLSDKSEIGFTYNHISNADIGDNNPGSDSFFFGYRVKENF